MKRRIDALQLAGPENFASAAEHARYIRESPIFEVMTSSTVK